jgi:hypothetical protein
MNEADILRLASYPVLFDLDLYSFLTIPSPRGDVAPVQTRPLAPLTPTPILKLNLPGYFKPLSQRATSADIDYLFKKGALALPDIPLRNALLQSYIEYIHPYMPLLELHEFLHIIDEGTGKSGRISFLVFQAVMFASATFVNMDYLVSAGYTSRRSARQAFFGRVRVCNIVSFYIMTLATRLQILYDFDCELDYVSLLQCLLLMTYWHEAPSHEKDICHWMGIAISLAYTMGLHKNPERWNLNHSKKKLRRRLWWACFIRANLVALGTRQPMRIKDEDYDVPMLTEDDFELAAVPESMNIISPDCSLARDVKAQRELAQMCVAKAKLCLCISHILSKQYLVLVRLQFMQGHEQKTNCSSMMLFPKNIATNDELESCDDELRTWIYDLPSSCMYSKDIAPGSIGASLFVQKSLLHMLYFTALSTLHRPRALLYNMATQPEKLRALQDFSKEKVREAASGVTRITQDLHTLELERYLPVTGVTVLLPTIIFHLLDIKACNNEAHQAAAMDGFHQCILVLEKLRDNYSSADLAAQFLEDAVKKVGLGIWYSNLRENIYHTNVQATLSGNEVNGLTETATAGRRNQSPTNETCGFWSEDSTIDGGRFVDQIDRAISMRTSPENELLFSGNPGQLTAGVYENIGLNNCLNLDETNTEMWSASFRVNAYCDSIGFIDDMNWIGQVWAGLVERS